MVYCTRCGTVNPDTATTCSNCGAPLITDKTQNRQYTRHEWRGGYDSGYYNRRHGSGIGLLIAGLFIIIIGLAVLTGFSMFWTYFWPIVLVLIGVWILLIGLRRNRRFSQSPPS
jgi:uncharacterized membrane protein YvbJ